MKQMLSLVLALITQSSFAAGSSQEILDKAHLAGFRGCDNAIAQKFTSNYSRIEVKLVNDDFSKFDADGGRVNNLNVLLVDTAEVGRTYTEMTTWIVKKNAKQCAVTWLSQVRAYPNMSCSEGIMKNSLVSNAKTGLIYWTKPNWEKDDVTTAKLLEMGNGCASIFSSEGTGTYYYDKD